MTGRRSAHFTRFLVTAVLPRVEEMSFFCESANNVVPRVLELLDRAAYQEHEPARAEGILDGK